MNFNFNATAGSSQSTSKPRLKGNDIYTVKFDECEVKDITGVKDPTLTYKTLVIKFSNEDGVFEHTVFEPRSTDFERGETEFTNKNGKTEKIQQPSNVESMMLLFKHLIDSINPTIGKAIDSGTKNLGARNWDELRALVAKILNNGANVETKIKLMINKKGEAVFPGFFAGLTKEGKPYVRNNFVGEKIAFSPYELTRINNQTTARPTSTDSFQSQRGSEDFSMPESQGGSHNDLDLNFDLNEI